MYYFTPSGIFSPTLTDSFHLSLSDNKSPQVSRTLLNILADFNSAVVWTVSIIPLISTWSCLFFWFLGTVSRAQTMTGITVIFNFQSYYDYYHYTLCEFFIPALIDGPSLESERQQVSENLLDSPWNSGRSQQCRYLDGLDSSSDI